MIASNTQPDTFPASGSFTVNQQTYQVRFVAQALEEHTGEAGTETSAEAHDAATETGAGDEHSEAGAVAHEEVAGEEHAAGETAAHEGEHGEAHGEASGGYEIPEELPNFYTFTTALFSKGEHHGEEGGHHAPWWVNPCFSFFYAIVLVLVLRRLLRNRSIEKPGLGQVAVESLFSGLANFFGEIVGPENIRKYVPFVGSLWLFILLNNWFALIPLFKSPTAHFQTTIALGTCVFFFVNYQGMKAGGVGHYFWHLCGAPTNAVGWGLAPLMLLLETVGTFVKPLSLSLRLYGNIFGEDKLLAIFLGLGMAIMAGVMHTSTPLFGLPLHTPFLFLSVLLGMIQATVFAMLAAVYIALLLPHHEHEHEEEHEDHGGHAGHA